MNWLGYVAVGVLVLLAGGFWAVTELPKPPVNGTLRVEGLIGDVEIIRDKLGVPHIYADHAQDAFFAQGFVTAQDRLFQMELGRRAGLGTLSELFGEVALNADKSIRTLGVHRAAEAFLSAMSNDARELLNAYIAGVNAWIARNHQPLEFMLLGIEPTPWQPVDALAVTSAMAMTLQDYFETIVKRARAQAVLPPERFAEINAPFNTAGSWGVTPAWGGEVVASGGMAAQAPTPALAESTLAELENFLADLATVHPYLPQGEGLGSNAWVIDGTLSETGMPLLANDPHLPNRQPATWYEVHLNAPGWHVVGASLPGVPGVIIGHNERIGWGVTNGYLAVQDLFIEQQNPDGSASFLFEGAYEPAAVIQEQIVVKGEEHPVLHEVIVTRHGPIVTDQIGGEQPVALGWTFTEPTDLLGGLLALNQATDWHTFRAGVARVPFDLNFVYADVEGNIGYQMSGFLPVRPNGYTGLPLDGASGEHEWQGVYANDELPHSFNPDTHFIATANHRPFGSELDASIGGEWSAPFRAQRITQLLAAGGPFSLADMGAIQADGYTEPYVRLATLLNDHLPVNNFEFLHEWDGVVRENSVAPVVLDALIRELVAQVFQRKLGETPNFVGFQRGVYWLLDLAEREPNSWWFDDPATLAQESFADALTQAFSTVSEQLGARGPIQQLTWGGAKSVTFAHPLGGLPVVGGWFSRATPTAGGRLSVNRDNASYRLLLDVSNWSGAQSQITTGQSGHPFSPHYADQLNDWRAVGFHNLLWTRDQVVHQRAHTLVLRPSPQCVLRATLFHERSCPVLSKRPI